MQLFTARPTMSLDRNDPLCKFMWNARAKLTTAGWDPGQKRMEAYVNLLSSGIAQAPTFMPNRTLRTICPQGAGADNSQQIADAVDAYLKTGQVRMALSPDIGRYHFSLKRDARWLFSQPMGQLEQSLWERPACEPVVVEGSPLMVPGKSARSFGLRPVHHFVMVKFGGCVYVLDGARGMVFDSPCQYQKYFRMPGILGDQAARLKWFRVLAHGREDAGGLTGQDDWSASAF